MSHIQKISTSAVLTAEQFLPSVHKVVSGNPVQTVNQQYASEQGIFSCGQWTCDIGAWRIQYGPKEHEYCQLLEGHVRISHIDGVMIELHAGDHFVIPAGFTGVWECLSFTRKLYVIYDGGTAGE